jgi:hypothetical protein
MRPKTGRSIKSKSSFASPKKHSMDHNYMNSTVSKVSGSRVSSNISRFKNTFEVKK